MAQSRTITSVHAAVFKRCYATFNCYNFSTSRHSVLSQVTLFDENGTLLCGIRFYENIHFPPIAIDDHPFLQPIGRSSKTDPSHWTHPSTPPYVQKTIPQRLAPS